MPKQTFFNLPDQKRKTLIQAAKKEFARAPYSEASIANIIKEAAIPRGSFYQYFEDKEDLYDYLLADLSERRQQSFIDSLKKHNGDLFAAISDNFKEILFELTDEQANEQFYRNVFTNMDYQMGNNFFGAMEVDHHYKDMSKVTAYINKELLAMEQEEHLQYMIEIMLSIMIKSIVFKYVKKASNDQVVDHFHVQLEMVRSGFARR